MTRTRMLLVAVVVVAVAAVAVVVWRTTGDEDRFAAYCDEVSDHQEPLGEVLAAGAESTGFLNALPAFRDLREVAPQDIRDEWGTVIERIEGLESALEDAGVDPASYDRTDLPEGVSKADRERIDAAAAELSAPESRTAFTGVAQHARDVCHTPLYL